MQVSNIKEIKEELATERLLLKTPGISCGRLLDCLLPTWKRSKMSQPGTVSSDERHERLHKAEI